jgi:hypothetical protein
MTLKVECMSTQEHSLEGTVLPEGLTQAEVDAAFAEIVEQITPTPESGEVKKIFAYKSVQRGEPQEHNYKPW